MVEYSGTKNCNLFYAPSKSRKCKKKNALKKVLRFSEIMTYNEKFGTLLASILRIH